MRTPSRTDDSNVASLLAAWKYTQSSTPTHSPLANLSHHNAHTTHIHTHTHTYTHTHIHTHTHGNTWQQQHSANTTTQRKHNNIATPIGASRWSDMTHARGGGGGGGGGNARDRAPPRTVQGVESSDHARHRRQTKSGAEGEWARSRR